MLSDELRKRLAEMSRRPDSKNEPAPSDLSPFRERLTRAAKALEARQGGMPPRMTMEEAVDGHEVRTSSGHFYLVEPDPQTLHPDIQTITRRHMNFHTSAQGAADVIAPEYLALLTNPARLLYLDIETTGFTGVPLFLIGLMYLDNERIRVSQLLARDYSEEGAVLEYLAEQFPGYDCLITFNGKTFDIPYIRDRYFANGIRCRFPQHHLDLLWPSRRRWREKLPDCRLQTLERWICGRGRDGDIPGMDIPETYHFFVRTGNAALLRPILEHNALDLITMGDILFHIIEPPNDKH